MMMVLVLVAVLLHCDDGDSGCLMVLMVSVVMKW